MCECGVPGGALNLNSISYPDHGRHGDLPLEGKFPMAEPGIEPGTSWLVVRRSDHQTTRLVSFTECTGCKFEHSAKILIYICTKTIHCTQ
jgi:hypothetical protein